MSLWVVISVCLMCTSTVQICLPRATYHPGGRSWKESTREVECSAVYFPVSQRIPTCLFSHSHSRNRKMLTAVNAVTLIFLFRLMCFEAPVLLLGNTCLSPQYTTGSMPTAMLSCLPRETASWAGTRSFTVTPTDKQTKGQFICVLAGRGWWGVPNGAVRWLHATFIATASGSFARTFLIPTTTVGGKASNSSISEMRKLYGIHGTKSLIRGGRVKGGIHNQGSLETGMGCRH